MSRTRMSWLAVACLALLVGTPTWAQQQQQQPSTSSASAGASAPSSMGGKSQQADGAASTAGGADQSTTQAVQNDVGVLNFALQQAYLQASFYSMCAFGTQLPSGLLGGGSPANGGRKGSYSPPIEAFAAELAWQTQANVRTLRAALGSSAAPAPAIDISVDNAWNKLATAAFNTSTLSPAFDPYANDLFFLHACFVLQDVAVTGLRGISAAAVDDTAQSLIAGCLGANAYSGGSVRTRLASRLAARTPWGAPVSDVVDAISSLRQRLSDRAQSAQASSGGANAGMQALRTDIGLFVPEDVDLPNANDMQQAIQQRLAEARQSAQQMLQQQSQQSQQQPQQQQQGGGNVAAARPGGGARRLMQAVSSASGAESTQTGGQQQSQQAQPQQQQQQPQPGQGQQPSGGDISQQERQARVRQGRALQVAAVDPATGLVFSRSPQQVLGILYGTGNAQQPGLFFPQGVNGQLK